MATPRTLMASGHVGLSATLFSDKTNYTYWTSLRLVGRQPVTKNVNVSKCRWQW